MAKTGRPKSDNVKKKVLSIRVEDSMYRRICDYAGKHKMTVTDAVVKDVDDFVKSYNYSDCDGMIDYFHVDFYYFGCAQNNGINIKIVPKTAQIKDATTVLAQTKKHAKPA